MPMFPLGQPLLPGAVLPLHVFEPRYRQLVQDTLADDVNPPEFGVTIIERGWEVGGGDHRGMIGTVARIVSFIAIGALMLAVGYLAPVPPRSEEGGDPDDNDATATRGARP